MFCNKNHRYLPEFNELPDSQAGDGRHKCTGCAFVLGLKDALNEERSDFQMLPDSQAGTGRHKDVKAAYDKGYEKGKKYNS